MHSKLYKIALVLFIYTHGLHAALIVVNSTGDQDAINPSTSPLTSAGTITLRSAIEFANANTDTANTINFDIPISDPGYSIIPIPHWTIAPASVLPTLQSADSSVSKQYIIDGYAGSPGGAQPNTDPAISNAVITIELTGNNIPANTISPGLTLTGAATIKGLCINSFTSNAFGAKSAGIFMTGFGNIIGNLISGNFIGTDITGTIAQENLQAIIVSYTSHIIGGSTPADRNILIGDLIGAGIIQLVGNQSLLALPFVLPSYNTIQANIIGLAKDGNTPLGINGDGITIANGQHNLIGGSTQVQRNIIANTINAAITLGVMGTELNYCALNTIQNNYIGTDFTGTLARGAGTYGIIIQSPANTIENNLITNASSANILLTAFGNDFQEISPFPFQNRILNNMIGTNATGNLSLSLDAVGIQYQPISVPGLDTYYGFTTISNNLISGNAIGIATNIPSSPMVVDTLLITGNYIGTDLTGTRPLPNMQAGILIINSRHITIGSHDPAQANLIAFNSGPGILLNAASSENIILGNTINANATYGVLVEAQSFQNIIATNQITANTIFDVFVHQQSNNNIIQGNAISGGTKGVVIGDNSSDLSTINAVISNSIAA